MNLKLDSSEQNSGKKVETTSTNREQFRKKMMMIFGFILGFILIVLLILFLISLLVHHKYSYQEIEKIMRDAAVQYYDNHKGRLPQNNETIEAVDDDILVRNEYMKPLDEYLEEGVHCLGRVEVDYNNGKYLYTPYLQCGKAYSTIELYKKATDKKNLVVSGYGLYNINNEFVYRGENPNNYVSLDGSTEKESLWRIVKFMENGEAVLIQENRISKSWDNRFNSDNGYSTGINDYGISRIYDELKTIYKDNDERTGVLNKKSREKLVAFDQCIGKRAPDYATNDNSAECSVKVEKQMMGLLTLSDYLNASIDPNCNSIASRSCQNYNYLKMMNDWWLATASTENSSLVYYVTSSGYIDKKPASSMFYINPVVHLSSKAMYSSGNGTEKNPYQFR